MIKHLRGELNASHLIFTPKPWPEEIRSKDGRERVIELRCSSYRKIRELCLQEIEKTARERVAQLNPDATYLRVSNMNLDTLENLTLKIYHASLTSKALILDLRNNGGGREADRMLAMFCQPVHAFTIPRDGLPGYPVERQSAPSWNHPMVVLCNQETFSNAEIFCHAVKHLNRAQLVGTATAGGVISAVRTTIPDVGVLQVPFRGWFNAGTGENLDSRGAQPDHEVQLTPADQAAGRDPQLIKAMELLKRL